MQQGQDLIIQNEWRHIESGKSICDFRVEEFADKVLFGESVGVNELSFGVGDELVERKHRFGLYSL